MRSIWAVARVTVREALRQKSAVALLVLLAVLLPSLGFAVSGDSTLPGRAQMFLDWSMRVSRLLLGLMTIFVACGTIAWELKYKQAYITLVKPIPRWQFLVGKWVGIGLLNVVLLAVVGLVIEGFAWEFRGRPGLGYNREAGLHWKLAEVPLKGQTEAERQKETREREVLLREVLTARQSLKLVGKENLESLVDAELRKRLSTGNLREGLSEQNLRDEIRMQKIQELAGVPPGETREFVFRNLETARRQGGFIQLRYAIHPTASTPNEVMSYRWMVGHKQKANQQTFDCKNEPVRTLHTIRDIKADAISNDGELVVTFVNIIPHEAASTFPSEAVFAGDGSLEILYPVGGFEGNLVRGLLMLLVQMLFMAGVGLFWASFLTFPVASLACLLVFFAASAVSYLDESLMWTYRDVDAVVSHNVAVYTGWAVKAFLGALPDFSLHSPSEALVDGRVIGWGWVITPSLGVAAVLVGVRTAVVLGLGCLILSRREVAQVIV